MPRRRADYPTSPPQHRGANHHQGHRKQQPSYGNFPQPVPTAGPSLQQLTAIHDAPASLEQINALNFPVLQRLLPSLQRIVLSTSYCTGYKIIDGNWERLDVEGPLFLIDLDPYHPQFYPPGIDPKIRNAMGRYAAFVMNRKTVNNLLIPLPKQSENVDTTNSVLISMLMQWEDCYGLSVFDEEGTSTAKESDRVGAQILELSKEMEAEEERMKHAAANAPAPAFMGMPTAAYAPQYASPVSERPPMSSGFDLMASIGPMIGAGNSSAYNSGYNSGDGGYVSGGGGAPIRGRKIDINQLFGPSISK